MSGHWTITDYDKTLTGELTGLLPPKIFDVHAHLYRVRDINAPSLALAHEGPDTVRVETWLKTVRLAGNLNAKQFIQSSQTVKISIKSLRQHSTLALMMSTKKMEQPSPSVSNRAADPKTTEPMRATIDTSG